ncbi:MAG: hypothetical protein P4L40_14820, partial [Terracidiphilus sp.]|nr:hypothetical protein [Terracidiphilus sp.]
MSARKPVLIVRESLAASPAFHSTLSATHTLRIAKDAAFIPDIIATPANGCEQPLSFVWLDGAAAFSTP